MTSPSLTPAAASLESPFDPRLESLRGLASLMVCVFHAMHVFAGNVQSVVMDTLLLAFNPAAGVMFFFVLSGYVLGGSLERNGAFAPYLARRLFRLIPPFAAAVLFAFACERLLRLDPAPSGLTPGFERMFWPQPTWDELWDNLLLGSYHVNGPTWTLYPELLGSLLLPFVVAAHGRITPRWRWALFAAIATLLAIGPYHTLLWFYFGCFLVKEFAALLANRPRLAAVMFLVGLAGLETAGTYNEFHTVVLVIPSGIRSRADDGCSGVVTRHAAVDQDRAAALSWANLVQPLPGALADLLRLRLGRDSLPPDRADADMGQFVRDGDVRDRRDRHSRAVVPVHRSTLDPGRQVCCAHPGADVEGFGSCM